LPGAKILYHPLGDYGLALRRQQRIEALMVQQMVSPASAFSRRQYSVIQRSQPRSTPKNNLPKFDFNSVRAAGRFYGARV